MDASLEARVSQIGKIWIDIQFNRLHLRKTIVYAFSYIGPIFKLYFLSAGIKISIANTVDFRSISTGKYNLLLFLIYHDNQTTIFFLLEPVSSISHSTYFSERCIGILLNTDAGSIRGRV